MTASVYGLRAEYQSGEAWVPTRAPRLSWKTATSAADWVQAGAEIRMLRGGGEEVHQHVGGESVFVDWPFEPLAPRERVEVQLRVCAPDGTFSEWSDPLEVKSGVLADGEWSAALIGVPNAGIKQPGLVRTEWVVHKDVRRATLYATALGAYQVHVNGQAADAHEFKPGWTSYAWRRVYETTDITDLLREGTNAIGIEFAGAWYTESYVGSDQTRGFFGDYPAVAAQAVVEYADGSIDVLTTDESWQATTHGPRRASGLYAGEDYDAREELPGWASPGFNDSDWSRATMATSAQQIPVPRVGPPVRAVQELDVQQVLISPSGRTILDFGQNLVGRLRIRVRGARGTTITLRHAEVLEHGELGIRPLRGATATDHYTLSGAADGEEWEPRFTFHGFRYAEVDGWPGELNPQDITAVVLHSDMERTGWFESSNSLVNQLHENAVWGMRGNFLSIPTDCPQRDERLGWTGDILAFAPSASFLYDCAGFLASWFEDVWLEQKHNDGIPPFVIPSVLEKDPAAAWGDAVTFVPTTLRERFADDGVLKNGYEGMTAWCDRLLEFAGERHLWEDGFQFGDWLDPDAPPDQPGKAKTDPDIVASAFLFRSLTLTAEAARILGKASDATRYQREADAVSVAYLREYTTPGGRMVSDAPTAYALSIAFGLYTDTTQLQRFGDRLAFLTRAGGYRIGTGFVGTFLIQDALCATGHEDVAGRLLLQEESPSWLHPVTLGATTIWERWDSLLDDGSINPGEMTSFNHYALGSVVDWMHRRLAGLAPAAPGYRKISVAPLLLEGFTHASAALETPYGRAESGWIRDGQRVVVRAVIPPNATAVVTLPDGSTYSVGSGSYSWELLATSGGEARPALSLDHPLTALIDDRSAYQRVLRAVEAHGADHAREFRTHTRWTPGRRIRDAFRYSPSTLIASLEASLADISAPDGALP